MLSSKELSIVSLIQSASAQAHGAINDGCRKAVRKAYSDLEDNGEFARAVFDAVKPIYKDGVARFFRRHGLNVTLSGTRGIASTIGGVLDRSKQNAVFAKLDDDTAIQQDIQQAAPRKPKELKGFAADRAKLALQATIKRLKDSDPDAAALLNDTVAKADVKERLAPLAQLQLDDSELKAVLEYVTFLRTVNFDANEDELILKAA